MAGGNAKEIKLRIKSVEGTRQITKAMQLVATSKLRRAKERMESSKPYAAISRDAINKMVANCTDSTSKYMIPDGEDRVLYIMIAGDRGLAGGYNNNIFKEYAASSADQNCIVLPVGKKAVERARHYGYDILSDEYDRAEGISVGEAFKISQLICENYLGGKFSRVCIIYTYFKTMMTQYPVCEQLLPLTKDEETKKSNVETIYEPECSQTLDAVVPSFLAGRIYTACCSAFVSEVEARRTAMDSASKNASEMISKLQLHYNRARQGAITQEITEIVAGSEQ